VKRFLLVVVVVLVVLGAGAAGAVIDRDLTKPRTVTRTVTVTKTVTVEQPAPSPESITLEVTITAQDCSKVPSARDTFSLRKPGNGLTESDVLAVASSVTAGAEGCTLNVMFDITPDVAFFVVHDEIGGESWGPFSYDQVKSRPFLTLSAD
jgi:hypothetical protein